MRALLPRFRDAAAIALRRYAADATVASDTRYAMPLP